MTYWRCSMFSDTPPPLVAPDTRQGRLWVKAEDWHGETAYCGHYDPYRRSVALENKDGKYTIYECRKREPFGERNHNWCFRCPAGFMLSSQHKYDIEMVRDRAMLVV